ncbi:EscU/YscU/HrcU family type III secretion system export apparatus switch protein [Leptospira sp. 96542]|nr:EscU/YscU/HrcU family type III secretion system export apparatus switch protein [Leptospira sp. 96542]
MKKKAIALSYFLEPTKAPKLIASAEGKMAWEVCKLAEKEGIPIFTDRSLVKSLESLPIGSEIPRELYEAVALIFQILVSKQPKKNI